MSVLAGVGPAVFILIVLVGRFDQSTGCVYAEGPHPDPNYIPPVAIDISVQQDGTVVLPWIPEPLKAPANAKDEEKFVHRLAAEFKRKYAEELGSKALLARKADGKDPEDCVQFIGHIDGETPWKRIRIVIMALVEAKIKKFGYM